MGLRDKIKNIFNRSNENDEIIDDILEDMKKTEEFEIIINDIDTFALYLKYRENPYVLITEICLQISDEILKLKNFT